MFDALAWAARHARAEAAAYRKRFAEQLYRDIAEAISAHIRRELQIKEVRNWQE